MSARKGTAVNVWTIVTTSGGMFHLRNLTTGGTSSIGHRRRESAEASLRRMVTNYPGAHRAAQ